MKISEVEKFKKGLDAKQKAEYTKIVDTEIKKLRKEGVSILQAEIQAIRKANSMFGDKSKVMSFSDLKETSINIVLSKADADEDFQLVLPIGTTYDSWYGELIFTKTFMQAMVDNQASLKNTEPFLNEGHDRGKAFAWMKEMRATDNGLEVKWDWTKLGTEAVNDRIYKYYSSEIGSVTDNDTGDFVYPVFRGCALTNSPVMKNLPKVHLQEVILENNNIGEEKVNDFTEVMEALDKLELSDEQKKELSTKFKVDNPEEVSLAEQLIAKDEVITTLQETITSLESNIALNEANKVDLKLTEALEAGKIKPVDKEKWEERLTKDFAEFSDILDQMAPVVKLDELGSEQDEKTNETKVKLKFEDFSGGKGSGSDAKHDLKDFT